MKALFTSASMGILVVGIDGEILLANPFAEQQFGYGPEELKGKKLELLIPRRFHDRHVAHRAAFHQDPKARPMGLEMALFGKRKDGSEFPVEVSLGHFDNDGKFYDIAFISDITIRKQCEKEIIQLNADLESKVAERTNRLKEVMTQLELSKEELARSLDKEKELNELKSRFVSTASHEFRTPLSTVLSSIYLMGKYTRTEEQPKRQKHIDRIIASVNMMTDILNDFLSVGKIEEGKIAVNPSRFNIREFMAGLLQETRNIGKNGQHVFYRHSGNEMLIADASLLRHIMINLLTNAIKFSPADSIIDVRTENEEGRFSVSVKDQGIGIPKEEQEHLFERFFRASNVGHIQGTGLGLHIVAKYTELMNGRVECESETGKGTVFSVWFTVAEKALAIQE